ncbi:hypothetical protein ATCC90586_002326 [Pythium insidiosum]|nr:hypothetical protein ATCC90586_002326 [Pythium insidiosum]
MEPGDVSPLVGTLDLGFLDEHARHAGADDAADAWVDTLVGINHRWLGSYARVNPTFSIHPSLLERNSLWMNTFFQKQRMITSPLSKQGFAGCIFRFLTSFSEAKKRAQEVRYPKPQASAELLAGPSARDILHFPLNDASEKDDGEGILSPSSNGTEDKIDGYHAVSPRMDEKRERAKEEAILRTERSRIIARRHLHCVKALQDLAQRARKHLSYQQRALMDLRDLGRDARARWSVTRQIPPPPEEPSPDTHRDEIPELTLARELCACAVSVAVRNVARTREAQHFRTLVEHYAATSMSSAVVEVRSWSAGSVCHVCIMDPGRLHGARHLETCHANKKMLALSVIREGKLPSVAPMPALSQHRPLALSVQATKSERPGVKLVIGAGVTVVYEFALGHFLEFIKIMKQTRPTESYATLAREIVQSKGIVGIWDGFFPWGAIQGVAKGAVFAWGHALTKQTLQPFVDDGKVRNNVAEVIAGGMGGGFQGFVLSPTLLLKTRVMTDPIFRQNMTPAETTLKSFQVGMKVIQNEGIAALMKGSVVFSMKRVADWSTRFFFSVQSEEIFFKHGDPNKKLTNGEKMAASLLGGVGSTFCTLPIDVMVAQIQQASKAGAKVSVLETFQSEFKRGGIKQVAGFATTGFVPRLAHVCFTTMIMKTATSIVYEAYESRQDEF